MRGDLIFGFIFHDLNCHATPPHPHTHRTTHHAPGRTRVPPSASAVGESPGVAIGGEGGDAGVTPAPFLSAQEESEVGAKSEMLPLFRHI